MLQRDGVVVGGRLPVAVLQVHKRKLGEAVGQGDFLLLGKRLGLHRGLGHGRGGIRDRIAVKRKRGGTCDHAGDAFASPARRTPLAEHVGNSGDVLVGKGGSAHVGDALRAAHGVHLDGKELVLLLHKVKDLLVQAPDLAIQRFVVGAVVPKLAVYLPSTHQDDDDEHGDGRKQREQDDRADLAHHVERVEVRKEDIEVVDPSEDEQIQ